MAAIQCQKPVEKPAEQTTVVCQKTTTETCHSKANQGHSFTDKVKEMAHSAAKIFDHKNHQENSGQHCHRSNLHGQQSAACHCPGTTHAGTAEKKEGHGGNFIANVGEHIKNMTSKKKKNGAGKCKDSSSSDSSSSDESDNETCGKKNCM